MKARRYPLVLLSCLTIAVVLALPSTLLPTSSAGAPPLRRALAPTAFVYPPYVFRRHSPAAPTRTVTPTRRARRTVTPTRTPTTTPVTIGFVNGDFEQGAVGWTQYSSYRRPQLISQGPSLSPPVLPASGKWIGVLYAVEASEQSYIQQRVTLPNTTPLYLNANYIINSQAWCDAPWFVSFRLYADDVPIGINDTICRGNPTNWRRASTDISAYAGGTYTFKFWLQSTYGVSGDTRMYLDDIAIENAPRRNP
jgi:hypothetical protein